MGQATEAGCDIRLREDYLTLHDRDGNLLVKATRARNRLYKVDLKVENTKCLQLMALSNSTKWHARLGHINLETIKPMVTKELVVGIPSVPKEKEICASCLLGKQARQAFPKATTYRASQILELIHGDLCGPISPPTAAQRRYILVLIDDHSRFMWSYLLKEKSEAFEKFKGFKTLVEQETREKIKIFRTDRGGEFLSQEFQAYCEKEGIIRHYTAPYTPQQNDVVERRNMTLLGMTRSIMKHMNIPNYLWGEAVRHATYLINRVGTRSLENQTPYEALKKRKPNVEHLRVFGCVSYAKVEAPHLRKLDDRSRILVYLGTEPGSKAYRLLDPTARKIIVSRDVAFDESKSWKWNDSDLVETQREPGMFTSCHTEVRNSEETEKEVNNEEFENREDDISNEDVCEEEDTNVTNNPLQISDHSAPVVT